MQTITSISKSLIELLKKLEFQKAHELLFSDDAESIDPLKPQAGTIKGLVSIMEYEKQFLARTVIHHISISEAIHAGPYFAIQLAMDLSINGRENRIDELCVYKVDHGRIISQQFFVSQV